MDNTAKIISSLYVESPKSCDFKAEYTYILRNISGRCKVYQPLNR